MQLKERPLVRALRGKHSFIDPWLAWSCYQGGLMYIDPENREFSDIEIVSTDTTEEEFMKAHENISRAFKEGKVTASSVSINALRNLQDDLRKAGYRKVK